MGNKYYTPEITEFHVGFECEFFNNMQDKVWNKISCDTDHLAIAFTCFEEGSVEWDDHISQTFRVKHLDRSDIEELGWKSVGEYSDEDKKVMSFQKGNWVLAYNFTIKRIFIFVKDYAEEPDLFGSARDVKVSSLEVKNKSEFKKLIKNLKIGE